MYQKNVVMENVDLLLKDTVLIKDFNTSMIILYIVKENTFVVIVYSLLEQKKY